MQFASKTREQAGFEPQPYRFYFSGKSMPASAIEGWDNSHAHVYLDRDNQWHGLGTNPANEGLAAMRDCPFFGHEHLADCVAEELSYYRSAWRSQQPMSEQDLHSIRVLERLERLLQEKS